RAGIRFDAPFNRLVERNDFRQQLIFYQQLRRGMIQYEDGVNRDLRRILRELDYLERNLEIQRRAVAIAIRRVDQTRENLNRPTPPPVPGQPQAQFGPTAAINLLTALSDLRSSQNAFMSVWLSYYATRLRLFQDLGVMRIDRNGLWIEESLEEALRTSAEEHPLPPDIPRQWLKATESEADQSENGAESEQRNPAPAPPAPPPPPAASVSLRDARRPRTATVRRTDVLLTARQSADQSSTADAEQAFQGPAGTEPNSQISTVEFLRTSQAPLPPVNRPAEDTLDALRSAGWKRSGGKRRSGPQPATP
ncbi:MAG: hypothetical protein VB858_15365, partial [Planctomycetaceae bacterium]